MQDNPNRRNHSIVFNLYAIKKACGNYINDSYASEQQEAPAKEMFKTVGTAQQQMLQASMAYIASYWVYKLPWKPLDNQRIYPLKKVLKGLDAVPAFELVLRQQFPYHITPYRGQPYINYDLVQFLHLRHWMSQYREMVLSQQPFANVQA